MPPSLPPPDAALRTWRPDPEAVDEWRRVYCAALNCAVARKCCSRMSGDPPAELPRFLAVQGLEWEALTRSTWTAPEVPFALYVGLEDDDASAAASAQAALAALRRITRRPPPQLRIEHRGVPAWVPFALATFERDLAKEGHESGLSSLDGSHDERTRCRVAMDHLRDCWPEMHAICDSLVREIRWFGLTQGTSPPFPSASLTQAWGAVFLAGSRLTLLDVIDCLVHETTHLELTARLALDRLVLNQDERTASPFRTKVRPLTRVLHATLVNVRLLHLWDRLADVPFGQAYGDELLRRRTTYTGHLRVGLASLTESAHWTPVGTDLLRSLHDDFGALAA